MTELAIKLGLDPSAWSAELLQCGVVGAPAWEVVPGAGAALCVLPGTGPALAGPPDAAAESPLLAEAKGAVAAAFGPPPPPQPVASTTRAAAERVPDTK